ncbi:MAG: hypothetical protein PHN56_07175 [Candidatus Nanoarchaeia archaeon]|nr:hypothetical protein [Candidatus Nanoarchaeia archaeon]
MIETRMWDDNFFSELSTEEKLLFIYFITSPVNALSGIYEIPLNTISLHTSIKRENILEIIKKFEQLNKIFYINGWVYIKNYKKYQLLNPKIQKNIDKQFSLIPKNVLEKINEIDRILIDYPYPMDSYNININNNINNNINKTISKNNNINKNNNISNTVISKNNTISIHEKAELPKNKSKLFFENDEFRKEIAEKIQSKSGVEINLILKEINNFCNYWMELNKLGTKRRWEMQQTFEVDRRLLTWFNNISQFKKQTQGKIIKL